MLFRGNLTMDLASRGTAMLMTPNLCPHPNLCPELQIYSTSSFPCLLDYPGASSPNSLHLNATTQLLKPETESLLRLLFLPS